MAEVGRRLAKHDVRPFLLLIVLYFLQGIPVGLAFGTIPFLLKSTIKGSTFTSVGLFSMATYPYSLKILWSPIVDSVYNVKIGRRRSWIIPVQLVSGLALWLLGYCVSKDLVFAGVDAAYREGSIGVADAKNTNIKVLTICFLILVFLCATQDIAVDGWALEILSQQSLSFASTAQTVGLNMGYFLSFTVFLAFNSSDFMNRYVRSVPKNYGIVSLGSYLKLSGITYVLVTIFIILKTKETPDFDSVLPGLAKKSDEKKPQLIEYAVDLTGTSKTTTKNVYRAFFKVLKLKPVQSLIFIHFVSKFAFQCNDAATNLKLLERGLKREDLAITVLIDFPFELIFGYYVAKWSSETWDRKPTSSKSYSRFFVGERGPLTPWLWGYLGRLAAAMMGSYLVWAFPETKEIPSYYFMMVILQHLVSSFMATVQFVGIAAFHNKIADPMIGGTYLTLLNTISNMGGTWPRLLIMSMIDFFTKTECFMDAERAFHFTATRSSCEKDGGKLVNTRDGYFMTNALCITMGLCLYFGYLKTKGQQLQRLPLTSWRCE
ncbi:LAMI_0G08768g1_1 [Lachancea mirantina]|uniref:LAMI_0G08768g1_1 n=1 Tax=Lachancea mirantina TaxID=1230905 RepID=A0A1G4KA31_9SACH|nr:LAMI_0G08768g1_1 [Lachancea mirantina]